MRYILTCTFLIGMLAIPGLAQMVSAAQSQTPPPQMRSDLNLPIADDADATSRMTQELERKLEKDRVVALKSDTDKLLKLSVELKACVDKTDENVLSLDVIKKAEEIEKLAKSVKDKMRGPN